MALFSSLDGPLPQPASYYSEVAAMARALGFNVRDDDFEYIDDVLLSRRVLELLVHSEE